MKNRLYLSLVVVAALSLAGWTAHAQLQKNSPARQTWEYKTITVTRNAGEDWSTWYEDSKKLPTPIDGTAKRVELGNQGWELVAVSTVEETTGASITYTANLIQYYKRPK